MQKIQLDVLDIQLKYSLPNILKIIDKQKENTLLQMYRKDNCTRELMEDVLDRTLKVLREWNHKFDLREVGGGIFIEFEFQLASYFQEMKIDNIDVRHSIHSNIIFENFLYKEIDAWALEENPMR